MLRNHAFFLIFLPLGTWSTVLESFAIANYMVGERFWDLTRYGSYCGVGGNGTPVDALDECCMNHDSCYRFAMTKLCGAHALMMPFLWWRSGNVTHKDVYCSKFWNSICGQYICECDRTAGKCFLDNMRHFRFYNVRRGLGFKNLFTKFK